MRCAFLGNPITKLFFKSTTLGISKNTVIAYDNIIHLHLVYEWVVF